MRTLFKISISLLVLTMAFLCGFQYPGHGGEGKQNVALSSRAGAITPRLLLRAFTPTFARASGEDPVNPADAYRTAMDAIEHDSLAGTDKAGAKRLTYAAIDGMLDSIGDPYTVFWTPEEYKETMETNSGDFVGIGARLDTDKDGRITIFEPLDDSPASRAGLLPGDRIAEINGKSTLGMDIQSVIELIHGPEGSKVRITINRGGKTHVVTLTRAVVHTRIVDYRMIDSAKKVGYIQLGMFNEQADLQFDAALQKLEKQGMRALVFDLRDNPGGLLQIAQDLASRFIDSGPIVWVKEKNGHLSSLNVEDDKHRSPLYKGAYPVVVLVNGDSASASEIVSGAIQDAGAGTLLGTRTYGKGLVQTIMPLADDSAVKITTQHYFTRNQHDINIKRDMEGNALGTVGGIQPNIVIGFTDQQLTAQRNAVRLHPHDLAVADKYDPQIQKAIQVLDQKLQ